MPISIIAAGFIAGADEKQTDFGRLYGMKTPRCMKAWVAEEEKKGMAFDYSAIDSVTLFTGTHPSVMKERVDQRLAVGYGCEKKNFQEYQTPDIVFYLERNFGWRPFEYNNYKHLSSMEHYTMNLTLKVWKQKNSSSGALKTYQVKEYLRRCRVPGDVRCIERTTDP